MSSTSTPPIAFRPIDDPPPIPRTVDTLQGLFEYDTIADFIGSGSHGGVYCGRYVPTGAHVAIKVMYKTSEKCFAREVSVLQGIHDEHCVSLVDAVRCGGAHIIAMTLVDGKDVFHYIGSKKLDEHAWQQVAADMLRALRYLHGQRLAHCDVKPENFVLTVNGEAVLVDMGGVVGPDDPDAEVKLRTITKAYLAPDILSIVEQARLGVVPLKTLQSADVYAVGLTLATAMTGLPPFGRRPGATSLSLMEQGPPPLLTWPYSEKSRELVKSLLEPDPASRPSAAHALGHSWFHEAVQCAVPTSRRSATVQLS